MTTIGSRIKVTPAYWRFLCGRSPRIGDIHIANGTHYTVSDIVTDGARTVVLLSKKQIRRVG